MSYAKSEKEIITASFIHTFIHYVWSSIRLQVLLIKKTFLHSSSTVIFHYLNRFSWLNYDTK